MEKTIKIELPDFCEGCKEFELECEKVHVRNLDGNTITMDYYSCSHKDFCCYQHMRLASGASSRTELFGEVDGKNIYVVRDEYGRIVVSDEVMRELITRIGGSVKEVQQ